MTRATVEDVFFSYRRDELELVVPFKKELERRGVSVFLDTDAILSGDVWRETIARAVEGCRVFVIFLSSEIGRSDYILDEVQLAYEQRKLILPIELHDGVPLSPALRLAIAGQQRILVPAVGQSRAVQALIGGLRAAGVEVREARGGLTEWLRTALGGK